MTFHKQGTYFLGNESKRTNINLFYLFLQPLGTCTLWRRRQRPLQTRVWCGGDGQWRLLSALWYWTHTAARSNVRILSARCHELSQLWIGIYSVSVCGFVRYVVCACAMTITLFNLRVRRVLIFVRSLFSRCVWCIISFYCFYINCYISALFPSHSFPFYLISVVIPYPSGSNFTVTNYDTRLPLAGAASDNAYSFDDATGLLTIELRARNVFSFDGGVIYTRSEDRVS